jgi:hypothetical protein
LVPDSGCTDFQGPLPTRLEEHPSLFAKRNTSLKIGCIKAGSMKICGNRSQFPAVAYRFIKKVANIGGEGDVLSFPWSITIVKVFS